MKNTNLLELISHLGYIVSANDDVKKNCEIFVQTVLYSGTSKETYVETRMRSYNNQKIKTSISVPPRSFVMQTSYSSS